MLIGKQTVRWSILCIQGLLFLFLRAYVKSVVKHLSEESNMMLADLFEKVRADLASQSVSSPVEFSLTTSPLPVCVNPEDMQGQSVILLEKRF